MKGKLEYDLSNLEEAVHFKIAIQGIDAYLVLHDIRESLRSKIKYGDSDYPKGFEETLKLFREEFLELLDNARIDLDIIP